LLNEQMLSAKGWSSSQEGYEAVHEEGISQKNTTSLTSTPSASLLGTRWQQKHLLQPCPSHGDQDLSLTPHRTRNPCSTILIEWLCDGRHGWGLLLLLLQLLLLPLLGLQSYHCSYR
jgi:hypothetical protein